jgi:hypothetical protein
MPVFQFIDRLRDEVMTSMDPESAGPDVGGGRDIKDGMTRSAT